MSGSFFRCPSCNKFFYSTEQEFKCEGMPCERLIANTVEASYEKHIPMVKKEKSGKLTVQVGSELHPMIPEHYIEWICLVQEGKAVFVELKPMDAPIVEFDYDEGKDFAVYAYCNLHGLWVSE